MFKTKLFRYDKIIPVCFNSSHTTTAMKHSEAAVLTVADLADLFTEDTEHLE